MIAKGTACFRISIRKLSSLTQKDLASSTNVTKLLSKKYTKINHNQKNNESTKTLNWFIKPDREKENQSTAIDLDNKSAAFNGKFYHEKIILGYSREQMCDLVFNVQKYKDFVPFCVKSEIIEEKKDKNRFNLHTAKNKHQFKLQLAQNKVLKNLKKKNDIELPQTFDARLEVGYPPIKESYISHVSMMRPHMVKAVSSETRLFEYLITEWKFHKNDVCSHPAKIIDAKNPENDTKEEEENSCIVEFYVSFKFHSVIYTEVANIFMDKIFMKMVEAFTKRANIVYGPASIQPTSLLKS